MPTVSTPLEKRLYDALRRIKAYDSPERLRRHCDKDFGLSFDEAIEFAYDNVREEAKQALKGVRERREKGADVPSDDVLVFTDKWNRALDWTCPQCGEPPSFPCRDANNHPTHPPHDARLTAGDERRP